MVERVGCLSDWRNTFTFKQPVAPQRDTMLGKRQQHHEELMQSLYYMNKNICRCFTKLNRSLSRLISMETRIANMELILQNKDPIFKEFELERIQQDYECVEVTNEDDF